MTFARTSITIPNKLHGDKTIPAYVSEGVAIAKQGRRWNLYHHESGTVIFANLSRPTLGEAKTIAQQLIDLPIDWEKPELDVMKSIGNHATAIRGIAQMADEMYSGTARPGWRGGYRTA